MRAQFIALSVSFPVETGVPQIAMMASPMNLSTTPLVLLTQSTIFVMYSLRNSTTSSGSSFSEIAVN